jgi:hypothetical protein
MGKASTNKKVARAARAGGGRISSGQPRSLLFPGSIVLVVVLGLALVVYARNDRNNEDLGGVPQLGDHIHMALAFAVCTPDNFLENLPQFESNVGIHTHGDGVMHIHPFSQLGVGANATLGRYLKDARQSEEKLDVSLSDSTLKYLGEEYKEGKTPCKDVKDPQLRMAYWPNVQDAESKPSVTTGDFNDFEINHDGGGLTIFYGDRKADIPKPPNASQLAQLGAADSGQTPDTSGSTTTVPSTSSTAPADASDTTVPADGASTTAPADATSTTVAP